MHLPSSEWETLGPVQTASQLLKQEQCVEFRVGIVEKREGRAKSLGSSVAMSVAIARPLTGVLSVVVSTGVSVRVSAGASTKVSATAFRKNSRAASPAPVRMRKRPADSNLRDLRSVFNLLVSKMIDNGQKKAKDIFFHEKADRDSIYKYFGLLQKKSTQNYALSVGS